MSLRLTVVNNAVQTNKTVLLVTPNESLFQTILTASKNKLRLKKPTRIFLVRKTAAHELEPNNLETILQDGDTLLISSGEEYIGKLPLQPSCSITASKEEASKVRVICSCVDDTALKQLENTSKLPGVKYCVGMPDLHAGLQYPIGAAFVIEDYLYPALVGGDIGCGMSFYSLSRLKLSKKDVLGKESQIATKIADLNSPWEGDVGAWSRRFELTPTIFDRNSLGTIGLGNHFAELQVVEKIHDAAAFEKHVGTGELFLLVHSGSRGYGKSILEAFTERHKQTGLAVGTEEANSYLIEHDNACKWAKCNRELIAHRFLQSLGSSIEECDKLVDVWHNNIEEVPHLSASPESESLESTIPESKSEWESDKTVYLHRKGAAPSNNAGMVVIPGSRGTLTYLAIPVGDQKDNAYSVAHGAGREWSRTKALNKLKTRFGKKELGAKLGVNSYGGVTVCSDLDILCEEAPQAYKDVDVVVRDLVEASIITVVASLRPVVTFKIK